MTNLFIWNFTNHLTLRGDLTERVKKISNIDNHIYILTSSNKLYHGSIETVEDREQVQLVEHDVLKLKDIDCSEKYVYVIDINGKAYKYTENLELVKEIMLIEDSKTCSHGHTGTKFKVKVDTLSVGCYGSLFITDSGELWAMGNMHQIGICSESPKKVTFFDGRFVYSASVGNDFAIAIVSKQLLSDNGDDCEEEVFISSCPYCMSSQLTSPSSQLSFSEVCPLGIPIPGSYDIETTSTSSKNDSLSSSDTKKCAQNDGNNENGETNENDRTEKNIIFRNTEAAKEFLTRQFSWMSSAGEEYLVNTGKPTRIIRENVSNMASLVYEGVKTVGDKVATLSRHVSGSSENNDVLDSIEDIHLPRVTSKDEFMWSLSQGTSEKELSEQDLEGRSDIVLKNGSNLLNCEVWTWGNIVHGQLGVGDIMKRERPMIITKLSNIGAHKISVQSYHAAVLTLDGRAFLWGRNDYNQVTVDSDADQSSPKLFNTTSHERIKDLGCGTYHTSLLTYKNDLYYIGKKAKHIFQLNTSPINSNNLCTRIESMQLFDEVSNNNLLLSSHFTLLNKISLDNNFITDDILNEQEFLEHMLVIQSNFIKPFQKKNVSCSDSALYESLCQNYIDLMHFTAANIQSLIEFSNRMISECDIIMCKYVDEHLFIYKNYLEALHDVISLEACKYISKVVDIPIGLYKVIDSTTLKKDKKNDEHIVNLILMKPFKRLFLNVQLVENILKNTTKVQKFNEILNKWHLFIEDQKQKNKDAQLTREFWVNSGKSVEHLKATSRRLLRESHKFPIFLYNAGIFSSHWFILFNDVFVHMNGSTSNIHSLQTIWVEPQQDGSNNEYQISVKTPEESIDLYTTEAEDKIQWFHALQNAIKDALGKSNAHQPPTIRSASYSFIRNGYYKDGKYTGRWLNAKMHGSGKLEWSDGRIYTGQFSNNLIHGFGRMENPNIGVYEGQWKENQQNGFGILKYSNGDVYKGYFKDGLPHGHGSLKQGNFTASAASIYIGDWVLGTKNGYGVMHDIVSGEKYLGAWSDNKKHGRGLIVTSDGIYYEGIFNQDILTGNGLMILEDETYYEGDFKGTGILGGKGVLTLKSGHMLEGNLTGSWNEGIKISNGVLSLSKQLQSENCLLPKSFTSFCTPMNQKWKALFRHCYQILGVPESNSKNNVKVPDTQKIWQNVAVVISNSNQGTLKRNTLDRGIENSVNNLDTIPQFGRDSIDDTSFKDVQQYISKAFDCCYHPLGSLLGDLTIAYNTTYGALKPHPLLLSHAVSELHSITKRLYDIVRILFPALPTYGKEISLEENDASKVISCQTLLFPIILPKVYTPLFILYTLRNKQDDVQYWKRLTEWNKQSDYTLMSFLSVDQKFFQTDSNDQPVSPVPKVKDQHFTEAIETLQLLKTIFSPVDKINVIRDTFKKMTSFVQEQLGHDYRWNMDDLFPVFLYVVVRARILQLGSELAFIEDFMDPSLENGELGIMFTTLKACYQHILQEKLSVT